MTFIITSTTYIIIDGTSVYFLTRIFQNFTVNTQKLKEVNKTRWFPSLIRAVKTGPHTPSFRSLSITKA